jgi:hypothetical protein
LGALYTHCSTERRESRVHVVLSRVTAGTGKPKTFATLSLGSLSRDKQRVY